MDITRIKEKFLEKYHSEPLIIRAPGRINLLGEHTDYNNGFVLPAAINKEIIIAIAKNGTLNCNLYSADYQDSFSFNLAEFQPLKSGWPNYIMGVVCQFLSAGKSIEGFDCVFGGNIPIGAGLSSSAALECGVAYGLNQLFNLGVDKTTLIKFAQKAEHEFAGVLCGIMDQFASVMGKKDHALRLDCRSLEFAWFPIKLDQYDILLCDTQVKHSLAESEYNTRRKECEQGVAEVMKLYPDVKSLRDVTLPMLMEVKGNIDEVVYNRCSYIIEENERVVSGCELLEKGDISGFGSKMYGSHDGLSKKYEVSCKELDFLVDFTRDKPYVIGARMMGGGFGGCTINLVNSEKKNQFVGEIKDAYGKAFNIDLKVYDVVISDGTGILSSNHS